MIRKAIILAAGMGTRLKPMTLTNHKCLTEVNGVSILENALEALHQNGIEQVTIVVGYLSELICRRIGTDFHGMQITYAENAIYDQTNTSYSLKLGLEKTIDYDELLLLEGDVFFEYKILEDLLQQGGNITVLEPYRSDLDGTFVELNERGYVVKWTHKSKRPKEYILEDKYKTVNIHKFSEDFVLNILLPYLDASLANMGGKEPIETVMMNLVIENSEAVKGLVLRGQKWYEIDDIADLERAEKIFTVNPMHRAVSPCMKV